MNDWEPRLHISEEELQVVFQYVQARKCIGILERAANTLNVY